MIRYTWFRHLMWVSIAVMCAVIHPIISMAVPVAGPPGMAFYSPPVPLPFGNHGDLIWYRASASTPPCAPPSDTWNVLYLSTDSHGKPNAVTGTVLIPRKPWYGPGLRPIISYAVGTHGLGQKYAPSIQLANGTDYENANIAAALSRGYAVLVTDNPGYTNGSIPTYMDGIAQGQAVLDIFKAASQIPGIPLSLSARTGIWGYSQGGQSAAWAGQLKSSYMPGIRLAGVAAGGTPANLVDVGYNIDGHAGSAFLLQVIVSMWSNHPGILPLGSMVNEKGKEIVAKSKNIGVFEGLLTYMFVPFSDLLHGKKPLSELVDTYCHTRLEKQQLGNMKIDAPVYLYHGTADEFIPLEQHLKLKEKYCGLGVNTSFTVFQGEHIVTQFQAAPYVLSWLQDRFMEKTMESSCTTTVQRPASTANPLDGNFIVSLNKWLLDAEIHLKTLDQKISLPETSTFTADSDMTRNMITGGLTIPDFETPIQLFLVPLKARLSITTTEPFSGHVSLDHNGYLHIHGHVRTRIKIKTAGISFIQLPFGCETKAPVVFPIDFDGPISSLGNGGLIFSGKTEFPPMKGSGIFNPIFTALMSGPGQAYSFKVKPPGPALW